MQWMETNELRSWMTGINKNVKGKTVRSVVRYSGSAIEYRRRCRACKESGYDGFMFKKSKALPESQGYESMQSRL